MDAIVGESFASPLVAAAAICRFLSYAATLLTAGGMLFIAVIADRHPDERPRLTRAVTASAAVAALATVVGVGLHGALLTGRGMQALADPGVLAAVVESTFGTSAVARVGALAALSVAVTLAWRSWALAVGLGAALVASGSFLLTGHTVDAQPAWLAVGSALAHTAAAAAWFGGLVLLVIVLRARRGDGDPAGRAGLVARFSTMATVAVLAVSIAGAARVPTVMQVGTAALQTGYGATLAVKVLLVGLIIAVAGYNHFRLVPAIRAAQDAAERRLRTTIAVEALSLVAVIAMSALLADLSPPRPPQAGARPAAATTEAAPL